MTPNAPRPPAGQDHRRVVRLSSAVLALVVLLLGVRSCGGDGTPVDATPSPSASQPVTVTHAVFTGQAPVRSRA